MEGNKNELIIIELKDQIQLSGRAAEEYLLAIADKNGDRALAPILEMLNPLDLASIIRDREIGAPSVLVDLLSPEQIAKIVQAEPLFWSEKMVQSKSPRRIVEQVTKLLYSILSSTDPARQSEIIEMIAEKESGIFFLTIPFWNLGLDETEFEEEDYKFLEDNSIFNSSPVNLELDTDNELFELVRSADPVIADRIISILHDPNGFEDVEWSTVTRSIMTVLEGIDETMSEEERITILGKKDIGEEMFIPVEKE